MPPFGAFWNVVGENEMRKKIVGSVGHEQRSNYDLIVLLPDNLEMTQKEISAY